MPRSRSSSIQSMTAAPSWTSPILWVRPATKRSRSVSVVLPASMWAMIPMLRVSRIRRWAVDPPPCATPLAPDGFKRPPRSKRTDSQLSATSPRHSSGLGPPEGTGAGYRCPRPKSNPLPSQGVRNGAPPALPDPGPPSPRPPRKSSHDDKPSPPGRGPRGHARRMQQRQQAADPTAYHAGHRRCRHRPPHRDLRAAHQGGRCLVARGPRRGASGARRHERLRAGAHHQVRERAGAVAVRQSSTPSSTRSGRPTMPIPPTWARVLTAPWSRGLRTTETRRRSNSCRGWSTRAWWSKPGRPSTACWWVPPGDGRRPAAPHPDQARHLRPAHPEGGRLLCRLRRVAPRREVRRCGAALLRRLGVARRRRPLGGDAARAGQAGPGERAASWRRPMRTASAA